MRAIAVLCFPGLVMVFSGCCRQASPPRDYLQDSIISIKGEVQHWGGSWEAWEQQIKPFQEDVKAALSSRPKEIDGIIGLDGFLFFRRSLEVLTGGDLRKQPQGKDPFPAIVDFNKQLRAKGVDMLFVPIPVKADVYPEKISKNAPPTAGPYVNIYTRKLMLELAEAGVECVDLLPEFLKARDAGTEPFYMQLDTHWSNRALRLAAKIIGERIKAYSWYEEAAAGDIEYKTSNTTCRRRGDIVQMLPEAERVNYRPMTLEAEQVTTSDGAFYEDPSASSIVLLGDSYAGVFHLEDCKNAGVTAHIAKETGIPVELIIGQGMGPNVRVKWLRAKKENALKNVKLVIWTLSERDLFNYHADWAIIPIQ